MHTGEEMPLVADNASMQQVVLVMAARRFGCVGITNKKGALVGIITDGDSRRHMDRDLLDRKPADIMTRNPKVIAADRLAAEALALMNEKKITQLFVLDNSQQPKGILHMHDCLRAGWFDGGSRNRIEAQTPGLDRPPARHGAGCASAIRALSP